MPVPVFAALGSQWFQAPPKVILRLRPTRPTKASCAYRLMLAWPNCHCAVRVVAELYLHPHYHQVYWLVLMFDLRCFPYHSSKFETTLSLTV
jgi:hypothetical protein